MAVRPHKGQVGQWGGRRLTPHRLPMACALSIGPWSPHRAFSQGTPGRYAVLERRTGTGHRPRVAGGTSAQRQGSPQRWMGKVTGVRRSAGWNSCPPHQPDTDRVSSRKTTPPPHTAASTPPTGTQGGKGMQRDWTHRDTGDRGQVRVAGATQYRATWPGGAEMSEPLPEQPSSSWIQ